MALRVLHVDDDPLMRDAVELALLLDSYIAVTSCGSGEEAVAKAAEETPDVILCDVLMPDMDGPATLARLRQEPKTTKIPLLFMTARVPPSEIERLTALGAAGVIAKPFDPKTLAKTMRDHLHAAKLASKTGDFSERLQADAKRLAMYREELKHIPDSVMAPEGLRELAHKLAGAAGVFNYQAVSDAALALEEAVIERLAGESNIPAIRGKLDTLLDQIARAEPPATVQEEPSLPRAAPVKRPQAPVISVKPPLRKLKMLIADDDPTILGMLAERCGKMGFQVETATNGMQLLIKAKRGQPDILVVDVNMPELDGLSVCSRFLDPGSKPVEVVVITGGNDEETVERCESLGLYYGRKGPDFWRNLEAALLEIYPSLADKIVELEGPPDDAEVPALPRILLVDDDPDIERFLRSRLNKVGVETIYASDATHAMRLASREKPSAIVSDCFMPDGDAQYLLHRLRAAPETENIPVIVLSGRKLDEATETLLKREIGGHPGAAHVLKKSFDTNELFGALQKYCGFARRT